jgi:serine/threonine-protein kinase
MSPEHVHGESLDARADVWALAVVAFETLTGTLPFAAETTHETLRRIAMFESVRVRTVRPDATPALEAFFARAFARRIEDRFQTADELARAFADALAPPPIVVPRKRNRIRVAAIATLCALVVGAVAMLAMHSSSDAPARVASAPVHHIEPVVPAIVAPEAVPRAPQIAPREEVPAEPARKPVTNELRPQKPNVDPSSIF